MKTLLASLIVLQAVSALAIDVPNDDDNTALSQDHGASGRLIPRVPRTNPLHCGTFTLQCKDAEGACNNACYHIKCIDPTTQTKVYIGSNNIAASNRNRVDSGNTADSNSVCRSFPFSQNLIADQAGSLSGLYQSDEWPMATHQQIAFANRPPLEWNIAGNRFKLFEHDQKPSGSPAGPIAGRTAACAGLLIAGDSYHVNFDLHGATQAEVNHCVDLNANLMNQNCDDPKQFRLSAKPNANGKMSSPYDPFPEPGVAGSGRDNHYAVQYRPGGIPPPELMQCSVEFVRSAHFQVEARVVDWQNADKPKVRANHPAGGYTTTLTGLPYDLLVTATGTIGTPLQFVYGKHTGQQTTGDRMAHYRWDSNSRGQGKGPDGVNAFNICKVERFNNVQYNAQDLTYSIGLKGETRPANVPGAPVMQTELTKCFFPCFQHVLP